MHTLTAIEEKTEVVVVQEAKSLFDQLVELPNESVVMLPSSRAIGFAHGGATVLHRTGTNGWLLTRCADFNGGGYLNRKTLAEFLDKRGQTVAHVLSEGRL